MVPRYHVDQLPVPTHIKEYLKTPNYYSENLNNVEDDQKNEDNNGENGSKVPLDAQDHGNTSTDPPNAEQSVYEETSQPQ